MATIKINIGNINAVLTEELQKTAEQASKIGQEAARKKLKSSITPYGLKRFSSGRGKSAGRDDSGSMIENLRALPSIIKSNIVMAKFGWGRGRSKAYYKYQEDGTAKIKAANSLLSGRQAVLAELPRLTKNMKQRVRRRLAK